MKDFPQITHKFEHEEIYKIHKRREGYNTNNRRISYSADLIIKAKDVLIITE